MSGVVSAIWRHPVKSMLGEALETVALGPGGLPGDRGYAIRDLDTGHVASETFRAAATSSAAADTGTPTD